MPFVNTFVIRSLEDGTTFTGTFADGACIVTEGYGGWQITQRPRDVGITEWAGRNPMAVEIPFIIDNYLDDPDDNPGIDTEDEVSNLEKLCGLGTHNQPPVCMVNGHGVIPHDYKIYSGHKWIIENLTWDRDVELRSGSSGRRLRCGGTILIRQFITANDILSRLGPKSRARKPKIYVVKKGDTLEKIAKKMYGDATKWKRIGDANKLRDKRSLTIGKHLKIPQ